MKSNSPQQTLRSRAEGLAQSQAALASLGLDAPSYEAMCKTVHELQVHQIELEMQNEQLQQTQIALDAARARYFDLYDLAPVGYCTVCESGLILEANFTAASLLDYARKEMVNKPVSHFIFRADQDIYYQCRKALFDLGVAQSCELRMRKRDGSPLWAHLQLSAAQDSTGALVQRMVLSDVSERHRLNSELQSQNSELQVAHAVAEKASRAKSDFLSNMTHELRSPLNAILGFAQLLESESPPPSATQKYNINQILRAGWYLLDLIGEILDLTSIESARLVLSLSPVPLSAVLRDTCASVESAAHKKGIFLHCEQPSEALHVRADRARLQQVLEHLLSNAIQYNRVGGTVVLSCVAHPDQPLRVQVRDTGCGISGDKLLQLFQPFNRLGRETTAEQGTGVGLALSKRLMELMGGTIGAHSTVAEGSVFWIELEQAPTPKEGTP